MPEKPFVGIFFSQVENILIAHIDLNFLGHSEVCSIRFADFFSVFFFAHEEIFEFLGFF